MHSGLFPQRSWFGVCSILLWAKHLCNIPPVWRIWGENPVLGKADECQLIDLGQQRPSVGQSVLEGWDLAEAKMPTVWSRTKQSRTMWETTTNSMTCDGYLQGIYSGPFSQQSPGREPDHRCKNACLTVSFCSCFSVAVLHYKYLVTSSVLQRLTC